jgi:two-component system response regulator MprA
MAFTNPSVASRRLTDGNPHLQRCRFHYVHVLIVDDEAAVRDSLSRTLRFEGYEVTVAANGAEGLEAIRARKPDGVILDVMMPVLGGLDACRALRAGGDTTPVLMLTARDNVTDRVAGLDAGADDYLAKPFSLVELLARVRALLRRGSVQAGASGEELRLDDLVMHPATREVRRGARPLTLTRTEFSILETFLRNQRVVLTRSAMSGHVWGYDYGTTSNGIDVYVGYLRRKLEVEGERRLLHTVRGVGYVLREEPL